MNSKGRIALSQIVILVVGLMAFSYLVGSLNNVSADGEDLSIACESQGGTCANINDNACLVWEPGLCPEELGSSVQCCKAGLAPFTPSESYNVGDVFSDPNDIDNTYVVQEDDLNEDGTVKEGSDLANWASGLGMNIVNGFIQQEAGEWLRKLFSGKGSGDDLGENVVEEGGKAGEFLKGTSGTIIDILGSVAIAVGVTLLAKKFAHERNQRFLIPTAWAAAGAGITVSILASAGVIASVPFIGTAVAAVITAIVFFFGYKKFAQEVFTYNIEPWQPEDGGENCDKCNDLRYGCNEYQCKTFGRACALINEDDPKNALCVWDNAGDLTPPTIKPIEGILPDALYSYQPLPSLSPTEAGVKVYYADDPEGNGCIPPFTGLTLGVETDKPAHCKIDKVPRPNLEEMVLGYMSGNGADVLNHTVLIPHSASPSIESLSQENETIVEELILNGESYSYFIRCEDYNGNLNPVNFEMQFCIQDKDLSAPIITRTNYPQDENFVAFGTEDLPLEIYTNEPAECRWDFEDKIFEDMQHDMSDTFCSSAWDEYMSLGTEEYGCMTTISGAINSNANNDFYIRCKDKPWSTDESERFANTVSKKLTFVGTQPLLITEITVNGEEDGSTISDALASVPVMLSVKTSSGANNGKAKCTYDSGTGFDVDFNNGGSADFLVENTQLLHLNEGPYTYQIECSDEGSNLATGQISFNVEEDTTPPLVVRSYYDLNNLRIITNEDASCVYNTNANLGCDFNFDDGQQMTSIAETSHYVQWETNKRYFVKCKDEFENRPLPGQCSVTIGTLSA